MAELWQFLDYLIHSQILFVKKINFWSGKTKARRKNDKNIKVTSFGKVGKFDMNWNAIPKALLCIVNFF